MIEISRLSLLILGELLVGLTLLSGVLLGMMVVRKGRVRKAAQHLVERIQSDKESRVQRLRKKLAEEYQYEGEKLEHGVHDLTQVEMRLYQNIINSYLKQDVVEFQQTDVDVENLVIGYQGLELSVADVAPSEVEVNADESAEIQRLQEENERLSEELRVTMDTMGRMLNEYSSMFAGGVDDLDKEEIRSSFESEKINSQVDIECVDTTEESSSNDSPAENMTATDIDGLVEPLIQIDKDEAQPDSHETVAGDAEAELDESPEQVQIVEPESDALLTEESDDIHQPTAENSMMDDLAGVDIEIPDVDELNDEQPAEPGSLEDEWAQLLAEDAESAESIDGETETDVNRKQGSA